jgi:methyl-accepting chemotaxis protein
MSAMIRQNADNANQADNLMKDTNRIVANANQSMSQLTRSMHEISSASEETSKIIKTIDEIAFQTNLLALNAAVEAARAGEAGAGFAVVADEVRNLAMRAAEAAKNTSQLIEGTVKKIGEGSGLVKSANDVFSEVAQSAEKVGTLVSEIAMASKEQSQGIDQINKAIGQLDKVVQHNAAAAEESSSAAEEMYSQADKMKKYVKDLVVLIGGKAADISSGAPQKTVTKKKPAGKLPAPDRRFGGQIQEHTGAKKEISPKDVIKFDEDEFKDF